MLPLRPPTATTGPTYPTRSQLLADTSLRRHALAVLAAAALAGCVGEPAQPQRTAGTPPAPTTTPLPGSMPAPQPLRGDSTGPVEPEPQNLRGERSIAPVPEPAPLLGKVRNDTPTPPPVKP